jgi:hypothetical protein
VKAEEGLKKIRSYNRRIHSYELSIHATFDARSSHSDDSILVSHQTEGREWLKGLRVKQGAVRKERKRWLTMEIPRGEEERHKRELKST